MDHVTQYGDEISFVALGSFNPRIFHPEWFSKHNIISEKEASSCELEVCHSDITKFALSWAKIEVVQNRFLASCNSLGRSEDLRDLISNVFIVLCETPIDAIGINTTLEFQCKTTDDWHKIGHALAPKKHWISHSSDLAEEQLGMRVVEVELPRGDDFPGYIRVTVQPTSYPPSPRVSFRANSHFEFKKIADENNNYNLPTFISAVWEDSVDSSTKIISSVLGSIYE